MRIVICAFVAVALVLALPHGAFAAKGGKKGKPGPVDDGGGEPEVPAAGGEPICDPDAARQSPASLDLDTCGCPTTFGDPAGEARTEWDLAKARGENQPVLVVNPDGERIEFDVQVIEKETRTYLYGTGTINVTNSGCQDTYLTSVVLSLEEPFQGSGKNKDPGLGPSDKNWTPLLVALVNKYSLCDGVARQYPYGHAETCYGAVPRDEGTSLILYDEWGSDVTSHFGEITIPPTSDNDGDLWRDEDLNPDDGVNAPLSGGCRALDQDGDGLYDEDPIDGIDNDGDGLIDEDDRDDDQDGLIDEDTACQDAVVIHFDYEFDITDLDLPAGGGSDLRLNLLATFKAGGRRGGICTADVDCNDQPDPGEEHVRTIQQKHEFDMPAGEPTCEMVTLVDDGATAADGSCATVDSSSLQQDITARGDCPVESSGDDPCVHWFEVEGTVSCICTGDPLDQLEDELPFRPGNMTCVNPGTAGSPSYWDCTISGAGDSWEPWNGTWDAWCVDTDNDLNQDVSHTIQLLSSYSVDGLALIDFPENMDLVNWIINQGFPYRFCNAAQRYYTYGDIQRAIWDLVEDDQSEVNLGEWSDECAAEIIGAAQDGGTGGEGFEPDCSQLVAVIMNPAGNSSSDEQAAFQINIAQMPMEQVLNNCGTCDCGTIVTNTAELICMQDDEPIAIWADSASLAVSCSDTVPSILPGDFCTQTIGGWAARCAGNNPGCTRDMYFDEVFGARGLIWGDQDYPAMPVELLPFDLDEYFAVRLATQEEIITGSEATRTYLRSKKHGPNGLMSDHLNPTTTAAGILGMQLTGATLNVAFDAAGICTNPLDCNGFPHGAGALGSLIFVKCAHPDLLTYSVGQVLAMANCAVQNQDMDLEDDCGVPSGITLSDLNDALTVLNENFEDCDTDMGCLASF